MSCNSNIGATTWNTATQVHGTGFGNWNPSVIVQIQSSCIFRITRGCSKGDGDGKEKGKYCRLMKSLDVSEDAIVDKVLVLVKLLLLRLTD